MTNQHPITPPPKLVQQWATEWMRPPGHQNVSRDTFMTTRAAQWGGDQELEACCEWLASKVMSERKYPELRAARRPKPPSLKEQALGALEHLALGPDPTAFLADMETIRRALESINE